MRHTLEGGEVAAWMGRTEEDGEKVGRGQRT